MEPNIRIHHFEPEEDLERRPAPVRPRRSLAPLVILLVLLLIGSGGWLSFKYRLLPGFQPNTTTLPASAYQAVFLINGQVYFGKLTDANRPYATLTDIYYLQALQPPLQGQKSDTDQTPQLSLVKLGKELHGPVDEMKISRQQIIFYEDLRQDSQVVKAIYDYTNGQTGSQPKN